MAAMLQALGMDKDETCTAPPPPPEGLGPFRGISVASSNCTSFEVGKGLRIRMDSSWDLIADGPDPFSPETSPSTGTGAGASRRAALQCSLGFDGTVTGISLAASVDDALSFVSTGPVQNDAPCAIQGSAFSWVRGEVIGQGSLGRVFKGLDQATGRIIAVKEILVDARQVNGLPPKEKEALENEVNIVKDLRHPRIVSYLGHDYIDHCLYVYMEYMPGGSLAKVLSQFGAFAESLILPFSKEILEGLDYLHTRSPPVVHRDLKGSNLLVGIDCRVKLSDFGCSKREIDTMSRTMKGSVQWMAPEVIRQEGNGRPADIWSFGCVVIEMATGKVPWGQFDNHMAGMVRIGLSDETPPLPETLSQECLSFICRCVQRDPSERPPAAELLDDPLIRDILLDS
mmetsp:Transcript_13506/g.31780  ORF Transcript_13506/g.31780 Transcript_13506/m.31780 type:complete len:399 (+) Transcript_13506:94-1290(+)